MQAVIIAGGHGTRLGGAVKSLIRMGGVPLILLQIYALHRCGVDTIHLLLGYGAEEIEQKVSRWLAETKYQICVVPHREKVPLGTANALWSIRELLDESFIVSLGDLWFSANLEIDELLNEHDSNGNLATLFCHPTSHPWDSDLLELDGNANARSQVVSRIHRKGRFKTLPCRNIASSGVAVFSRRIFDHWNGTANDLFGEVVPELLSLASTNVPFGYVSAVKTAEPILDIGTPERIVEADGMIGTRSRRPAVFWDRDGTLNDDKGGFVNCPHDYRLKPDAAEAINKLRASQYRSVCVTNQGGIELGYLTPRMLDRIHTEQDQQLASQGAYLDRVYYCPHFSQNCGCRKPKIGMINLARSHIRSDTQNSWLVGDSATDIECGKQAGLRTIQLITERFTPAGPTCYARSLTHAADIILGKE